MQNRPRSLVIALSLVVCAIAGAQVNAPLPQLNRLAGSPGQGLGAVLDAIGDIDGDGVSDVIAGSPDHDVNAVDDGSVTIYSGVDGSIIRTHAGAAAGDLFGTSVSGGGDANGDGIPDYIVGAPGSDLGSLDGGLIQVFSGATGVVIHTIPGTDPGEDVGVSVDWIGDVDNDGRDDFVFGNPAHIGNGLNPSFGGIAIVSGLDASLLHFILEPVDRMIGRRVHGVGDIDQDGVPDYGYTGYYPGLQGIPFTSQDRFHIRSGATNAHLQSHINSFNTLFADFFAESSDAGRDIDGDGVPDLIFSMYFATHTSLNIGVEVRSGASGALIHQKTIPFNGSGRTVALVGDLNGDGRDDFAYGDPSVRTARFFSGTTGNEIEALTTIETDYGMSFASPGDTNGDGLGEVWVGAPGASAAGAILHQTLGGARPYGVGAGPLQTLAHGWLAGPPTDPAAGAFFASGAAPGSVGIWLVALGPANFTSAGVQVLIDDTPGEFFHVFFNFDSSGQLLAPANLRNPQLAGFNFYTQVFEVNAAAPQFVFASPGLEQRYTQ